MKDKKNTNHGRFRLPGLPIISYDDFEKGGIQPDQSATVNPQISGEHTNLSHLLIY